MTDLDDDQDRVARVRPAQLAPGAVIAQSLDNQWVSAELTRRMIDRGQSLRDVADQRGKEVRAEYFRSLINTRQVVMNRVFFYNNPAVARDLLVDGPARDAHRRLLADGALVPYLLGEHEPTDRPGSVDLDEEAFRAWQDTVAGMPATDRLTCVRLSWDDRENVRDTRSALFNPFAARVQGLTAKDIPLLASQVGVEEARVPGFAERIGEIVQFSNEQSVRHGSVTRNVLYERFVTRQGYPISDGRYDSGKPFAGEVKQLIDLIYNVNLADALGMYPLTPLGSLRRVALQEWRDVRTAAPTDAVRDPEQLVRFLQRQAFSAVQDRLTPAAVDSLALDDIRRLRETSAWDGYMREFEALTRDPSGFADGIGGIFDRYVTLNGEILRLAAERRGVPASVWDPVIEVVVTIGGAVFTAVSGNELWSVVGALGATANGSFGGSVQLALRNRRAGRREQKFARELAPVRLDGEREWNQFLDLVRRLPEYRERRGGLAATSTATVQEIEEIQEY
ncbi:hypothetical protein [Streptomyces sp. NPDC054784]